MAKKQFKIVDGNIRQLVTGDGGCFATDMIDEPLVEVQVPPKELTPQRLEEVASQHAGRDVRLVRGEFITAPLTKLTDFWTTREKLAS